MWWASADSQNTTNTPKLQPATKIAAAASATGAPRATRPVAIGQLNSAVNPVRSGRAGCQRADTTAPMTAPAPAVASSTPKTPALP